MGGGLVTYTYTSYTFLKRERGINSRITTEPVSNYVPSSSFKKKTIKIQKFTRFSPATHEGRFFRCLRSVRYETATNKSFFGAVRRSSLCAESDTTSYFIGEEIDLEKGGTLGNRAVYGNVVRVKLIFFNRNFRSRS